jgi:hypothetical protein
MEITNQARVGTINDAAYLAGSKPSQTAVTKPIPEATKSVPAIEKKYDWYQNPSYVFISYKVSSPDVSQEAEVTFDDQSVNI